jgi:hypothetical protein
VNQLSLCLLLTTAQAPLPRPSDPIPYAYTQPSTNGQYFAVMLPPEGGTSDARQIAVYREQTAKLKRAYPASGLYRKGESTPLWTYPGEYCFDCFVSNDGETIVVIHGASWFTAGFPKAAKLNAEEEAAQLDGPAVSFYRRSGLAKEYTVRQLVGDPAKLRHSIAHVQWRAGEGINDAKGTFNLFTQDGQRCRFDLATGELLEKSVVDYTAQKIVFGIIFAVVAVATIAAIRWLVKGPKGAV